jgi:hypothetical protein
MPSVLPGCPTGLMSAVCHSTGRFLHLVVDLLRLVVHAQPCCEVNLLEPRLVESHTTVIIPFDDRVIFVRLLNCAEFSGRLSEVAQTLDAISGIEFLAGGSGLGERWLLGTV